MDIVGSILNFMEKPLFVSKKKPSKKEKSFKCDVCGRNFTERKNYVNHRTNHKRNKKKMQKALDSEDCDVNSTVESQPIKIDDSISPTDNDSNSIHQLKCGICGRIFNKKKQYVNHKANHKINKITNKHLYFKRGSGKKNPQNSNVVR